MTAVWIVVTIILALRAAAAACFAVHLAAVASRGSAFLFVCNAATLLLGAIACFHIAMGRLA